MHSPEMRRVGSLFLFFFPLDPVEFCFSCFYHFHFLIFLKSLKLLVKIMAIADRQVKVSAFFLCGLKNSWLLHPNSWLVHPIGENIQSYVAEASYYKRKFT